MKVHHVVLMIVDTDDLGAEGVKQEIENVNYPNDCLSPQVVSIETQEVDWDDDHPLNQFGWKRVFLWMFRKT